MTNLNGRLSVSHSNSHAHYPGGGRTSVVPPPGTPRGVHGMSMEDLVSPDLEKGSALDDKDPSASGKATKTKVVRTWYGRKRTVVVDDATGKAIREVGDLEMLPEGVPEPRPAVLYAPIYNGLACGLSVCESCCDLEIS